MQNITMWHNIACSKSNSAKCFLDDNGVQVEIRDYLENPPSKDEIKELLKKLNMSAKSLIRESESLYSELNIKNIDDEDKLIEIIEQNPILIQRPILIGNKKAFIARPPKNIEDIINEL
ncbi:arsenate reductase (ArsC) family protein [Aliarcobacter faecis]|uniref:arsenate reductase (glutaredoxin) n=1 Tax=Aliarcobacter faecis TaxID=1564138 RepID=UPI00047B68A9|nr:arsenate reductase (glutaredoxin) [Aliarcobacter faecis]QKF73211.1 arsenate reductase (ArsC) family protein [Aliarcobacter faecis]